MHKIECAPIIIFAYRRKIDELITSLLENDLAKDSELYIFSDGYKSNFDMEDVLNVRNGLKSITGFKEVHIQESNSNQGLASSVIKGTSAILNKYEKVIVLEDDLVVANNFLNYMNEGLDFYKNDKKIWSLSGYTPQLECFDGYSEDVYLSVRASSWGWATWSDRWEHIDWDIKDWDAFRKDKQAVQQFNLGGDDMFTMLKMQMLGKIDSWAIRWCYNQYKHDSYTVYPVKSKLINNGFDAKGTHNSDGSSRWVTKFSSNDVKFEKVTLDNNILQCFKQKYNMRLKTKVGYLLREYGGYKLIKNISRRFK